MGVCPTVTTVNNIVLIHYNNKQCNFNFYYLWLSNYNSSDDVYEDCSPDAEVGICCLSLSVSGQL